MDTPEAILKLLEFTMWFILFISLPILLIFIKRAIETIRDWHHDSEARKNYVCDPVMKSGSGYKVRMDDGSYVYVNHSDLYPDDPPEPERHAGNYIWNGEIRKFIRKDD